MTENLLETLENDNLLLIKVTSRQFAEDFLNGGIFMNSLYNLRKIEDKGNEMTKDYHEGAGHVVPASNYDYVYVPNGMPDGSDWKLPTSYLDGGIWKQNDNNLFLKVFCMYNIKYDAESKATEPIDPRIIDFGDSYVFIKDVAEFIRRINRFIIHNAEIFDSFGQEESHKAIFGPVEYINESTYAGPIGPYRKRDSYSWQNEYRLCLDLKEKCYEPLKLEIGSIRDIAIIGNTKELIGKIRVVDDLYK